MYNNHTSRYIQEWCKNFFFCHREDTCYSHQFKVERGHYAKVRFFSDNGCQYHINVEEGVSDCPCGPRLQWFNNKTIECRVADPLTGEIITESRPHVLAVNSCDEYLELDPGKYRFCVLDCNYNPVVPDEDDILLRVQHCIDTRVNMSMMMPMAATD